LAGSNTPDKNRSVWKLSDFARFNKNATIRKVNRESVRVAKPAAIPGVNERLQQL
jgi:hypothetical protein